MFANAEVLNPHTLVSPSVFLQPLFSDFNSTATPPSKIPEVRNIAATYTQAVVADSARPSTNNNTNAYNSLQVDGLTRLHLVLGGTMTNGGSANNKDIAFRVIRWYPVRVPLKNTAGAVGVDGYIPIVQEYTAILGNNAVGALSASATAIDYPQGLSLAGGTLYLADTIAAVKSAGVPDENLYSPADDTTAILTLDVHGAAYVTIDIKDGSATPDNAQVFYGLE